MAARVDDGAVVLIIVGAFACSWLAVLIWVVAVWETNRRRERARTKTAAVENLSRPKRRRDHWR